MKFRYFEKACNNIGRFLFKFSRILQNVLNLYNRQNTRNLYFNQSRGLGPQSLKKLLHFSSVAILSNSQEVVTKNATQSSFNKNVSRPIKVQQLVEYTPCPKFSQIIQKSQLPLSSHYWIAICNCKISLVFLYQDCYDLR